MLLSKAERRCRLLAFAHDLMVVHLLIVADFYSLFTFVFMIHDHKCFHFNRDINECGYKNARESKRDANFAQCD